VREQQKGFMEKHVIKIPGNTLEVLPDPLSLTSSSLKAHGLRGIHCGSGLNFHPGWLNTDQLRLEDQAGHTSLPGRLTRIDQTRYYLEHDHTQPLPLPDNAFDWAFSEHFIEHIHPNEAVLWLHEIRRVLRKDGLLRLSTPDLRRYVAGYLDRTDSFYQQHRSSLSAMGFKDIPTRPAWMINQIFRFWGHQWVYDLEEVRMVAMAAGFAHDAVVECNFRQGLIPDVYELDLPIRSDESLYVEICPT
jgi:predicted SAM-dependent methyltransferase